MATNKKDDNTLSEKFSNTYQNTIYTDKLSIQVENLYNYLI